VEEKLEGDLGLEINRDKTRTAALNQRGISRVNVGRCAERGKEVLASYEDLKDIAK